MASGSEQLLVFRIFSIFSNWQISQEPRILQAFCDDTRTKEVDTFDLAYMTVSDTHNNDLVANINLIL